MAWLTLALAGGTVVALTSVPITQFVVVGYLGVLLAPVGMAVGVTAVWAVGALAGPVARRLGRSPAGAHGRRTAGWTQQATWFRWTVAVGLAGLSAWVVAAGLGSVDGTEPTLVGWPTVRATDAAVSAVARVAPPGSFGLRITGPTADAQFAIGTGADYLLVTRGFAPRLDEPVGYPTFGRPLPHGPSVVVTVAPDGRVAAHLVPGRA